MQPVLRGAVALDEQTVAAMRRGFERMGNPAAEVVVAADFDTIVRELTGSSTYSSDRGTGYVGAKTLDLATGPVVVVNAKSLEKDTSSLERLMAHEAGHVLIDGRTETLKGRQSLVSAEWQWNLMCLAGYSMQEYRIERALEGMYPPDDGGTAHHVDQVLWATTVDLLNVLYSERAATDIEWLHHSAIAQLDRLSKVLALAAVAPGRLATAEEGELALQAWQDYVAGSWDARVSTYGQLAPATEAMSDAAWSSVLVEGVGLEQALLSSLGFEYQSSSDGGYGFYSTLSEDSWRRRGARAVAQQDEYDANNDVPADDRPQYG